MENTKTNEETPMIKINDFNSKIDKPITAITNNVAKFDSDKNVIDSGYTLNKSVPSNAIFTDTIYTHPSTHPANMITILDNGNKIVATNVEDALQEITTKINTQTDDITNLENNKCDKNDYVALNITGVQSRVGSKYTITLDPPPTAYTFAMKVTLSTGTPNDANPTLNINNLGDMPLVDVLGNSLKAGAMIVGIPYTFSFYQGKFYLTNSNAENLTIKDVGKIITATNVEDALQEIAGNITSQKINIIPEKLPNITHPYYPVGISLFRTTASDWSTSIYGTANTTLRFSIETHRNGTSSYASSYQIATVFDSNENMMGTYKRCSNASGDTNKWNYWEKISTQTDLDTRTSSNDYVKNNAFSITSGTATNYIVDNLSPLPKSMTPGFNITIIPHITCGDNPILNIKHEGGNMSGYIKNSENENISSGSLIANRPYSLIQYGGNFFLRSSGGGDSNKNKTSLNIYCQSSQPTSKEGIWLKSSTVCNKIVNDTQYYFANTWIDRASGLYSDLPISNYDSMSVAMGDYIYIPKNTNFYKYNVLTDTYTKLADIPFNFYNGCTVSVGTDIYLIAGNNSDVYKFDIITETYTKLLRFSGIFCAGSAAVVGDYIYLFGTTYNGDQKKAYKYSISNNNYTPIADIPYIFNYGYAANVGTDIYIFGGGDTSTTQRYAYKYNTITNTYTKLANIPYSFHWSTCVSVGTDIYLFGSEINGTELYNYKYNTLNNTYTKLPDMPYKFHGRSTVVLKDKIFLLGGYFNNQKYVTVLSLKSKQYDEGTLVLVKTSESLGLYYTELLSPETPIGGTQYHRMTTCFDNAFLFTGGNLIQPPAYYGNGISWIQFRV